MADPRISRKSNDIILKHVAQGLGNYLFARFNLPFAPITAVLPSELPVLDVHDQATDVLLQLGDDSIADLEFQTTQRPADLTRFAAYNIETYRRHRQPVHTVVFYGAGITSAPSVLAAGSLTFRVTNIFVGREDGDAVLARLRDVAARGEGLTPLDRVDAILLPLMRQTRPLEAVLREAIAASEGMARSERSDTLGAMMGLAYNYLEEDAARALLEELKMANVLQDWLADELEQRWEQGHTEGELEGERKAVRRAVRSRFGAIPPALEQRIAQADSPALESLLDRIVKAASVEDV
jgi:hypothetical protein